MSILVSTVLTIVALIVFNATVVNDLRDDTAAALSDLGERPVDDSGDLVELARIHSDSPFIELGFGDQRIVFDYSRGEVITNTADFDAWAYAQGVCDWVAGNPEIDTVSFATVQLAGAAAMLSPGAYALAWSNTNCATALANGPQPDPTVEVSE